MTFFKGYRHFIHALSVCFNERKEAEALGLFIQATSLRNVATILMLLEVFTSIKPLLLYFQKSQGCVCLSEAQAYVTKTLQNLEAVKTTRKCFSLENFQNMMTVASEETFNLPPSSRIRTQPFVFDEFKNDVFLKFIDAFIMELNEAFSQIKFWSCFAVFDPRKLPEDVALLHQYGNDELEKLLRDYGSRQSDLFEGTVVDQEPDVDAVAAREEWGSFKNIVHLKRQEYREQCEQRRT